MYERWSALSETPPGRMASAITRRTEITGRVVEVRPDRGVRLARLDGVIVRVPAEELVRLEPAPDSMAGEW
jgi:hypothetical protein